MALLASDDAIRSFDVATSLLIQCRMAHEQLQAAGSKEEKLLNRLCRELQSLRNQVPESFEITRDDSEVDSFPMPIHLEQASHDSNRIVKDNSRRSSVHSTESRASRFKRRNSRNMTFDVESDPVTHSYSINGITRKEPVVPRNTLVNMLKTNIATDKRVADSLAKCWQLEEPERRGCLARLVRSNFFGVICGAVILANAIFILYATDYEMKNLNQPASEDESISVIIAIEFLLISFYVLELALKLIVHKFYFFWNSDMVWNWFDFLLVLFSIVENAVSFTLYAATRESGGGVNLGFLRLLRLCKIVKILRVFRALKFFSELRLTLDCVVGSLMNCFWCFIMLLFVMYVFALLLQQGVLHHLQDKSTGSTELSGNLQNYFSCGVVTLMTLFQSCTGGVDWSDPYKALEETQSYLHIVFLVYVAFVFISVWNIVTSSFVEKALKLAQPDLDMLVLEQQLQDFEDCRMLAALFKKMLRLQVDEEGHERLGLEEFRKLVETDEFRSYLQTRGIDIKNAETFFKMLVELQGEDTIDAHTFANACVRMKGAATSIDLQTVMFTTHLMNKEQRSAFQNLFDRLIHIESVVSPEHLDFDSEASSCSSQLPATVRV
mmetsp:Transcript_70634/g.111777  ORF Transcript_70634/g.111777 Transcript_70634/m.111777 type:complete len:608 (-) Transcript_70634:268-2091(-)